MNIRIAIRLVCRSVIILSIAATTSAQAPTLPGAAMPREEAAALAQGFVLLAEGKHDEAARTARRTIDRFPRSAASLALLIEADIASGGANTALTSYESWIGGRSTEEPSALRRVARAYLYEWSRQTSDMTARSEALLALADDGDVQARAVIAAAADDPSLRAKGGDHKAVDALLARMKAAQGSKVREIQMLGETRSDRAAASLVDVLDDPMPENRAAAADALGKLEFHDAIPRLKPLLDDPRGLVRVAAAGALYRMGDFAGAPVLEELASSEYSTVRRSAALLMASQPTESWKALVRGLASDEDPAIKLDAARLLAPHDPAFARSLFDQLLSDPNLAIQEQATMALAESPLAGFADLRRLLRTGAGPVKVRAAKRILELTR